MCRYRDSYTSGHFAGFIDVLQQTAGWLVLGLTAL